MTATLPQDRTQKILHVTRGTHIRSPSLQRGHPHFFIRDAVSADDGKSREVPMQTLDVSKPRSFDVEDHGFGTIPGYFVS